MNPCAGSGTCMGRVQVSSAQHTCCRGEQRGDPAACWPSGRAGCRSSAHCKASSCAGELNGNPLDCWACVGMQLGKL